MDYELNEDQRAILDAVASLLERHAGPARAIELAGKGEYDEVLDDALRDAGFADVARGDGTGPLEAALLAEAVSRSGGVVAFAAEALVAPGVLDGGPESGRRLPAPIALVDAAVAGPVRFARHARTLLVLDGREARVCEVRPGDVEPVRSNFGFPMGRLHRGRERGAALGDGTGERLRSWWRVALAVEAVGAMSAALDVTVAYCKERRQFGRTIGSFQAVQHRLASCAIALEGSRWLAYEAAYRDAPGELAAAAATFALQAAGQVFAETHQLSGAIGFTHEHDLHVFSMRLHALRQELGGVSGHRRALAASRWGVGA